MTWRDPFKTMAASMRQGAIVRGYAGTEHATAEQLTERFAEFNNACVYCGRSDVKLGPDHDVPIAKGGSNAITNILPACLFCNIRKSSLTAAEYRERLPHYPPPRIQTRNWKRGVVLESVRTHTMHTSLVNALIDAGWTPPEDEAVPATFSLVEVAAIFSLDRSSVRRLIASGDLRAIDAGAPGAQRRTPRIEKAELTRFIESRRSRPVEEAGCP